MNTPKDGGPAFPVNGLLMSEGMTMRQWYKGQAYNALSAYVKTEWSHKQIAEACGMFADAMLAEDSEHARKEQEK